LYFTTRFAIRLPAVRVGDAIGLGVAIGAAFGLRVGAVFAVFISASRCLRQRGSAATTRLRG